MNALSPVRPFTREFEQLHVFHDVRYQLLWCYLHGQPRPCFTPTLLREIRQFQEQAAQRQAREGDARYLVAASRIPGVFNLGGDLDLFTRLIAAGDRDGLLSYATACIDVLYPNIVGLGTDVTTISLVQGDALGGGFEAALSSQVVVAERGAKMGLPEVLFNLFPGMGAYSLLSRRLDPARAERMILSGRVYGAEELHEMGVVDILAEDGEGERAVYDYVRREERSRNAFRALRQVRQRVNPITYAELIDIARIWVDAALGLEPRDLRMMERLVSRQSGKTSAAA